VTNTFATPRFCRDFRRELFHQCFDFARAYAIHIRLLHNADERCFRPLPMGQEGRKIGLCTHFWNLQLDRTDARVEAAATESIAIVPPHTRALVAGCTHALRDISVHDLLEEHCNGATQEIRF